MRSQKAARARADSSSKLAFVLDRRSPALKPRLVNLSHAGLFGLKPLDCIRFAAWFLSFKEGLHKAL